MQVNPALQHLMAAELGKAGARAPWRRIARSVLDLAGPQAQFLRHAEKPWASITFSGARHTVWLAFSGARAMEAADAFIAALPDHEFTFSGRLVADATIASVDQQVLPTPHMIVECELLLLDDT